MLRRSFLKGILLAGMAPAIVKAGSLMRINPEIIIAPANLDLKAFAEAADEFSGNKMLTIEEYVRRSLKILEKELTFATDADFWPTAMNTILIDQPMVVRRAMKTQFALKGNA